MSESPGLNPQDADVPEALRDLQPAQPAPTVSRAIWYQSGYHAGRRQLNLWRVASLILFVGMSAQVGLQLATRGTPAPNPIVVVKTVPAPSIQAPIEAPSSGVGSYSRLLNSLTEDGVRAWDERELSAGNPHAGPSRRSNDLPELNAYPINERG